MPRKRSVSGRARVSTIENRIQIQAEKINKKIRSLERGKNYGTYKSKELIRFVSQNDNLKISTDLDKKDPKEIYEKLK